MRAAAVARRQAGARCGGHARRCSSCSRRAPGATLQERWTALETEHWARWEQGVARLAAAAPVDVGTGGAGARAGGSPGLGAALARAAVAVDRLAARRGPAQASRRGWLRERIAACGVGARRRAPPRVSARRCGSCCAAATGVSREITDADLRAVPGRVSAGHGRARRRALRGGDARRGRRCGARSAGCAASG